MYMILEDITTETMLLSQPAKQQAGHAHPQVTLQQSQCHVVGMTVRNCGLSQHDHDLFRRQRLADQVLAVGFPGRLRDIRWIGLIPVWSPVTETRPLHQFLFKPVWPKSCHGEHGGGVLQRFGQGLECFTIQGLDVGLNTEGIVSVTAMAVGNLSPPIKCEVKWIFTLPLKGLKAQISLQSDLRFNEVWSCHHPGQDRHQLDGIAAGAAKAEQQAILMGLTAQTCPAALDEIGQLPMIMGPTATTQYRSQELMSSTLPEGIRGTSTGNQKLCRHHIGGGERFKNQLRSCCHDASPGSANRVQARSGWRWVKS